MASFNLHPELLAIITSLPDRETLKTLRLTSHFFCESASKNLFSTVSLYTEDESCDKFESIMTHSQLKGHVRKIYLNTVEEDYSSDEDHASDELPLKWKELLPQLPKIPNLDSVVLRFDKNCMMDNDFWDAPQSEDYRATIIRWLGKGLAALERPLQEMAIQNHQNVTTLSEDFQQSLCTLSSLRLNVVHELDSAAPTDEIEKYEVEEFYARILPSVWLKPTMGSIQKLSLYSNLYWGFYPKLSLEGVHFPNLQSLALGNFAFFEDQQLDWILSHSSTLQDLYLDDCPILFQTRVMDAESDLAKCPIPKSRMKLQEPDQWRGAWLYHYPRRWSDYFASFGTGLPHLRHFAIGHSKAWDLEGGMPLEKEQELIPALLQDRYMAFDGGLGPSQYLLRYHGGNENWPLCDEEDREALKALCQKIEQWVDRGEFIIGRHEVNDLVELCW